jgi:hypothetical protein
MPFLSPSAFLPLVFTKPRFFGQMHHHQAKAQKAKHAPESAETLVCSLLENRCCCDECDRKPRECNGAPARCGSRAVFVTGRVERHQVGGCRLNCDRRFVLLTGQKNNVCTDARTCVHCERYAEKNGQDP